MSDHDRNAAGGLVWVWCDAEMAPSTTRGGRCSSCGATDHEDMSEPRRLEPKD